MSIPSEIFCAKCGVLNAGSRRRCRECGSGLHPDVPPLPPRRPSSSPPPPRPAAPPPPPAPAGLRLHPDEAVCPHCHRIVPAAPDLCAGCGNPLRGPAHPPEPLASAVEGLRCPTCGTEMWPGESRLSTTFSGFLMYGFSWLELYFRPRGEHTWDSMVRPAETRATAVCTRCGGMWIAPRTPPSGGRPR